MNQHNRGNNTFFPKMDFPVYVKCMTYNHAAFIEDAMDGFCIQETSFPYLCVIVDDSSLDAEAEFILKYTKDNFDFVDLGCQYPTETEHYKMFLARHKVNNNCYFLVILLKYNHYQKKEKDPYFQEFIKNCKYVAFCEGDDFWVDPYKLQKQYEILENNEQCVLVHSAFDFVDEKGNLIPVPDDPVYTNISSMKKNGYLWHNHLVFGTPILLCTTMCRVEALERGQQNVDYSMFMSCARQGRIDYIDAKTASYRIQPNSLMRTNHQYVNSLIKQAIYYQLYAFSNRRCNTDYYYKTNLLSRILVSEAIISSLIIWKSISVPHKYKKLLYILLARPLNSLLLPAALLSKLVRKVLWSLPQ